MTGPAGMAPALLVQGLHKRYGAVLAVDRVDLSVSEGEILGIVGPNGSGKTTTVECSYGLRRADAGTVRLFGVDPQRQPDRAAELIGIQLQDSALPDRIKTWEALHLFTTLGRRQRRRTGSTAHLTVTEALAQWGPWPGRGRPGPGGGGMPVALSLSWIELKLFLGNRSR